MFWHLTLREIDLIIRGVVKRIEQQRQHAEWCAYLGAFLNLKTWSGDPFPSFDDVKTTGPKQPARRQTWQEQKALVQVMHAAFGGDVIDHG